MKFYYTLLLIFISISGFAQNSGTDYWWQFSPEIRLNTAKFEFRFRPYDSFILTNTDSDSKTTFGRRDFMAGYIYKKFKLFVYSKFETRRKSFIGPRIDFNTRVFNKRLLVHLQYRYFWGLNTKSKDHQYIVTMFEYDSRKFINPGIFSYNKETFDGSTLLFYGPSASFELTKNISFLTSFMKDINTRSRYFAFVRLNIKFKTT